LEIGPDFSHKPSIFFTFIRLNSKKPTEGTIRIVKAEEYV